MESLKFISTPNVISAIAGGLILLLLRYLWSKYYPKLSSLWQNEPTISGEWRTTFQEGGQEHHETVDLKQIGRTMSGSISYDDGEKKTDYKFSGTFKHRILTATFHSVDETNFECGAFALQYEKQNYLVGKYIFFSEENERMELTTSKYKWTKN